MDPNVERLITVVVDAIPPGSDRTVAEVYRAVCGEMTSQPSREQGEQVVDFPAQARTAVHTRRRRMGRRLAVAGSRVPGGSSASQRSSTTR